MLGRIFTFLHCGNFLFEIFLRRAINQLSRHVRSAGRHAQICRDRLATTFGGPAFCANSYPSTREAPAVDLALKLDLLAVCAVFAFVGAILLGAF
jgi:hypothetical protein